MSVVDHCRAVWSCVQCNAAYDLDDIEQYMVDVIQRKSMAFSLQDVCCMKCKAVSFFLFLVLSPLCFIIIELIFVRLQVVYPIMAHSVKFVYLL